MKALIDTGADMSAVSEQLVSSMGWKIWPTNICFKGVDQRVYQPLGLTWIWLNLDHLTNPVAIKLYVIREAGQPLLFGKNFIRISMINIQAFEDGYVISKPEPIKKDLLEKKPSIQCQIKGPSDEDYLELDKCMEEESYHLEE